MTTARRASAVNGPWTAAHDEHRTTGEHLSAAAALAAEGEDRHIDWPGLLHAYYRHVRPAQLLSRSPAQLLDAVTAHLRLAEDRRRGEAAVRVTLEHGGRDAAILVVTEDMPFVVDSLGAELRRRGLSVRLLAHPVFAVHAGDASVQRVPRSADGAQRGDERHESWVRVEVDRVDDPAALRELDSALRDVLGEVALAVRDWAPMRTTALELADALDGARSPAAEFLRWLVDDHFTFLGYRTTAAPQRDGPEPAHLGIRRTPDAPGGGHERLPRGPWAPLRVRKSPELSRVHRSAELDVVTVSVAGGEGEFSGLFTHAARAASLEQVPVLREKAAAVLRGLGLSAVDFSGRDLLKLLETYPRDEIFQTDAAELIALIRPLLPLQEWRQLRLVLRYDPDRRFASCVVYLPRERYTPAVARRVEDIVAASFRAVRVDTEVHLGRTVHAQLYFVAWAPAGRQVPQVDTTELEGNLLAATRSWSDELADLLGAAADDGAQLRRRFPHALPDAYKQDTSPRAALDDLRVLAALTPASPEGACRLHDTGAVLRMRVYRTSSLLLTRVLPVLRDLGLEVADERPHVLTDRDGADHWIYDFTVGVPGGRLDGPRRHAVEEAFLAVESGRAESDALNALVALAALTWRQVVLLRAYVRYLRQSGSTFSQGYYESALIANPDAARGLVRLFEARFEPGNVDPERAAELARSLHAHIDAVATLDEDRALRALADAVSATLRTNYFRTASDTVALKLDPTALSVLPHPRPYREIWVYSPSVEGVHLRFGPVARGGLRWSDRREDFRSEVLGLVRAQAVKNAVIVPVGAKGGFVATRLPDPGDRTAWSAAGTAAYRTFVGALLELTDNLVDGEVVGPDRVVRADGDDPYLVVAADKGTASFSDLANAEARARGFWLDDAFASGGTTGYDHKAMGITARGAWESVRRHLWELGLDERTRDFTVAGVGDMSGDVFGNGMLLSPHIRLVAAFDHRHVFLDPDPDPRAARAERARLFALPASSWDDYDRSVLSPGGGVFARTRKAVPVAPEVRRRLALPESTTSLTPQELISAVLRAPVDLLYNGGIGTYVKAGSESHAEVGDRGNDAIRVDGAELRCRALVEGGNLGLTQRGRIEAARAGVRLNNDAIDNSAGVDTSDHEVNLKILLDRVVDGGTLTVARRNELLVAVADEVAARVLRHNYEQNLMLSAERSRSAETVAFHRRLLDGLEDRGLDRALEALPDDGELERRAAIGDGLTSPELAVLAGHVKNDLVVELLAADRADTRWLDPLVAAYFPGTVRETRGVNPSGHPLRREIGVTVLVNQMVNKAGLTFASRAREDCGASLLQVAQAYLVAWRAFDLEERLHDVEALDASGDAAAQTALLGGIRRLLDRIVRRLLVTGRGPRDVDADVARLRPRVRALTAADAHHLIDVLMIADATRAEDREVAELHHAVLTAAGADALLTHLTRLPGDDRWTCQARHMLVRSLLRTVRDLVITILTTTPPGSAAARIDTWSRGRAERLGRVREVVKAAAAAGPADLAALSVAVHVVEDLHRERAEATGPADDGSDGPPATAVAAGRAQP